MTRRPRTLWTDAMVRELRRLYATGADDSAIGAALNVLPRAVKQRRVKLRLVRMAHSGQERRRIGRRAA